MYKLKIMEQLGSISTAGNIYSIHIYIYVKVAAVFDSLSFAAAAAYK